MEKDNLEKEVWTGVSTGVWTGGGGVVLDRTCRDGMDSQSMGSSVRLSLKHLRRCRRRG